MVGTLVGTLGGIGVLVLEPVPEDGSVLHDDVEEVNPVQVRESLEVLVRVGVVEVRDGVRDVALAALEERPA